MKIVDITTGKETEKFMEWDCPGCGYPHNDFISTESGPSLVVVCDHCGLSTPIDELP